MGIAQKFGSACELANKMPERVARFIEIDKHLKRRFREDSMTDVLLASFLELPKGQIVVDTPQEAKTGADFDLFVTQRGSNDIAQYRIQAKRLCDNKVWEKGRYHRLDHRVGPLGKLQVDILCGTVPPDCRPLYAFYNHSNVVQQSGGAVPGIALADAHGIQRCVHQVVVGNKAYKQVGKLAPLFFPLATILCSSIPGRPVATPNESWQASEAAILATRERWPDLLTEDQRELFEAAGKAGEEEAGPDQREREGGPLLELTKSYLFEPSAAEVRADVLAAAETGRSRVRTRHIRRPRVILVGPAEAFDAPTRLRKTGRSRKA